MLKFLPLGLLVLTFGLVAAGGSDQGFPEFDNSQGQSPCQLVVELVVVCHPTVNGTREAPILQTVSECTCNTVVYNLWSACRLQNYGTTNSSNLRTKARRSNATNFQAWIDDCEHDGYNITWQNYTAENAKGMDIPQWAYQNVTSDLRFDTSTFSTQDSGWTTAQKLAPVIVGVSLILIFASFFVYRRMARRRRSTTDLQGSANGDTERTWGVFPRVHRVRSKSKFMSWSTDDFESGQSSRDSRPRGRSRHVRLASSGNPSQSLRGTRLPMKELWESIWRVPWKKKAIPVLSLPPRKGFRIDDTDLSTNDGHNSRPSTLDRQSTLYIGTPEPGDLTASSGSGIGAQPNGEGGHQEREALISSHDTPEEEGASSEEERIGEDEQSILLISRTPGVDFSMASSGMRSSRFAMTLTSLSPSLPSALPSPMSPGPPSSALPSSTLPNPHSEFSPVPPLPPIPPEVPPISPTSSLWPSLRRPSHHTRTVSAESIIRPPRDDPTMLFPPSVRAAGYTGRLSPFPTHSRNVSADSLYTHDPMTPPPMY